MASWNHVRSGFDADDETVNFGTRIIAENNGSLYETHTIATIESLEKVDEKPSVLASFQHSKVCVAIDRCVTIFQDDTCERVLCNVSFPSTIARYCIAKNGSFLFTALTNGTLYCLHLPDGRVMFTKSVPTNQNGIIEMFLREQREETSVILVLNNGAVYRLSDICFKVLEMTFTSDDESAVQRTMDAKCFTELFKGFTMTEVVYATVNASSEKLSVVMIATDFIFTWPDEQYAMSSAIAYRKLKFLNDNSMLCLRTDNILSIVCPNTLLGLRVCEGPVFDFAVMRHDNYCDILLLTESKQNRTVHVLCLVSYPDFQQKLEINVSVSAQLVETLHASSNIFYVEIITENKVVGTVRVKTISESIPEMRLARLLRKRQFDAAESFAERMGLSKESVYCSKAALLVQQLGPWAKSDRVDVDALVNILDKVQDVQYVTECCSKALVADDVQMKRIYLYARQRIMQNLTITNINSNDRSCADLSLINGTLHRLETFQMIQDVDETNTAPHDDAVMKEWIRFSRINLWEELKNYLHIGRLISATLIWTRHLSDISSCVSTRSVRDIFIDLPDDLALSSLWPWLTHFIPTLLSLLPDAMDEIVSWGLRKLKYLEISHRTSWPQIGTDFANKFVGLLKFENNQRFVFFYQEHKYQNAALKRFMHLLRALSDIQRLKDDYRLRIPFDTYIDSPEEAVYVLLDKIKLNEISNFVNTFLRRYMLNNNLQNDAIFSAYVQRTINNSNSWLFAEEAAWEKRVAVMINFIYEVENQLKQVLAVLRKAPVPWSPTVTALAEMASNFEHGLAFKIKIERDYVPIKLILQKYGCTTADVNNNRLISLIIKENRDSMINDLDVLIANDRQLRQDIFCRCINVRLNDGNMQKVMEIMQHVENDVIDALDCYEGIVNFILAAVSFRNATTSLDRHIEILGCLEFKIHNLLTQPNICSFRCNNIINTIKDLKSLYVLKKDYKINVSLKDYRMQKSLILHNCIAELLPDIKENNLSVMYKKIVKIAELLGLEKSYATLSFAEKTGDMNVLEQFVCDNGDNLNSVSDNFTDMKNMCLLALCQAVRSTSVVNAAKQLSASTLNTCKDSDLRSALTLYTCINACPSLSIQRYSDVKPEMISPQSWKIYTIYKDQTTSLEQLLSLFERVTFFYLYYSNIQINSNEDIRRHIRNEEMTKLLHNFFERIKKVQLQHNEYSLLQIFKILYFVCQSTNETTLMEMNSILSQLLTNLLKKLCTGRSFDLHLGLSCLFMLPEEEAEHWLSTACVTFETDYNRHYVISTLGYEYSRLGKRRPLMQTFERCKLLHIWAQRLSHYSIAYKEIFTNSASSRREILQQIVSSNEKNIIPLLHDYCRGFGINFDDCLLLRLETLLKMWKPTITVSDTNGNKELIVSTEEVHELREKCNAIVAKLDTSILKRSISTLWEEINFYHYEVFLVLLDLVGDKDAGKRDYLCFLQNYTRNGAPTAMERNEWMHLNPGALPPIAQWRLPFLFKVDIWKIITSELNLQTYEKWLEIAPVLKLETHLVCSLAIKGEVTRAWEKKCAKSESVVAWSLYPKNIALLKGIKDCVQRITDSVGGFYYGTAALYYVVNHTPSGADRVAAAKECYEYAQLAAQNSIEFEEGMLQKIKSKYLRFTAEHILRTHELEKDDYLALIENPYKLMHELYYDESILLRYRVATNYRPDVNAAVNELGRLFSFNVTKLHLDLLQKWLRQFSVDYTTESLCPNFTLSGMKETDWHAASEDNLLRACYLLEAEHDGDTDLFTQLLINIGFGGHSEDECNHIVHYRALWVLQSIVDTATLEELTKQDICTFRKYVKSLWHINKFELLGYYYDIDAFDCSKHEFVQMLWKDHHQSPSALCVIAQISIDFEINDISLWDDILSRLTKLRMVNELKTILLQVRSGSLIVNCNGYKLGWQLIVSEPFREIDTNLNEEQINNCIEAICLLYSCPVTYELDFSVIVRHCFQCKQACLAAALLPFLNESEKQFVVKTIAQTCETAELVEELNHLRSKGVLTAPRSIAVVQKFLLHN